MYKYSKGPFKRYVTLRGEGGISKNVTERDRGGRGFALALRNAGMSAYEQVDLLTLYRDENRKYYKIEIYFVFYPIIIIN